MTDRKTDRKIEFIHGPCIDTAETLIFFKNRAIVMPEKKEEYVEKVKNVTP